MKAWFLCLVGVIALSVGAGLLAQNACGCCGAKGNEPATAAAAKAEQPAPASVDAPAKAAVKADDCKCCGACCTGGKCECKAGECKCCAGCCDGGKCACKAAAGASANADAPAKAAVAAMACCGCCECANCTCSSGKCDCCDKCCGGACKAKAETPKAEPVRPVGVQ